MSGTIDFLYKTTGYYTPEYERSIASNNPQLAIEWPALSGTPTVSGKDALALPFATAECFD